MIKDEYKVFHLNIFPNQGAKYAIITGDPNRVEQIASYLDNSAFLSSNREYTIWSGEIEGERVLVCSHGIGGPSTAICVEELSRCGIETFIRIGTCGGMDLSVKSGDIIVVNGAIRQEGTSQEYLPLSFPAVADFEVTTALVEAARETKKKVHVGVVQCKDSFYGQHSPEDSPVFKKLNYLWGAWLKAGCLASEMESAALFTVASSKKLRAGCILHTLWNQERKKTEDEKDDLDTSEAIISAVNGIRKLIFLDR